MRTTGTITRLLLAWTPFFLLWVLFVLSFMETSVREALVSGAVSTGSAAVLGLLVWRFTAFLPWPERISPKFVLAQLGAGLPYALAWTMAGYVQFSIEMGRPILELVRESPIFGWRLLMGFWLYAIVAGVCYAVRTRNKLREQERVAARAEALALQARLASLRGQLNPHFLFNALNSVTALIRHDPVQAERAVGRLADLLRYALDGDDQATVSLEEEWTFTREYLEMQRLRFGDRLRYEMESDPSALACGVPPFVLQPLVENAVEHAISPRPEGGRVDIRAAIENGCLVLTVEDDGHSTFDTDARPGHGHGLATLRARLDAAYGQSGLLELKPVVPSGLRAAVTIPVRIRPKQNRQLAAEQTGGSM